MAHRRDALDAWAGSVDELLAQHAAHAPAHEPPALIGKLLARLRKELDLELHVRAGWLFGVEYLQLVDFEPSTGRYQNAVLLERSLVGPLLEEVANFRRG